MNKRKTPQGDGNWVSAPLLSSIANNPLMNKIKTPTGDGNCLNSVFLVNLPIELHGKTKSPWGDGNKTVCWNVPAVVVRIE